MVKGFLGPERSTKALGFRVQGADFGTWASGLWVYDFSFTVGLWVWSLGGVGVVLGLPSKGAWYFGALC